MLLISSSSPLARIVVQVRAKSSLLELCRAQPTIAKQKSEATAHIWVVSIDGRPHSKVYCKSPYKAMRYAFLLKKRTGLNISDNSFTMAAALGKIQARLTLHSLARHLPHPRLLRDCTSQGHRHRSCGRAHGSQCGRTAHFQSCAQAHEKACPKAHGKESQSVSVSG